MNDAGPAAYSNTDDAETGAILILKGKLHAAKIKSHISERDKVPNHDGSIELVEEGRPIGSCVVQVKTIPFQESKFQCDCRLISYSVTRAEPFILFCVDIENNKAYWKHLHELMPEYKPEQKSFVIHFSNDDVFNGTLTRDRITEICKDYLCRISQYPSLKKDFDRISEALNISFDDIVLFQRMSDLINSSLENRWPILKSLYLPGTWKVGFGLIDNKYGRGYQAYRIPYGQLNYVVRRSDFEFEDFLKNGSKDCNLVDLKVSGEPIDPENESKEFIQKLARRAIQEFRFKIGGHTLCSEIVCSFIDYYHDCIEIDPDDIYSSKSIKEKLYATFFNTQWLYQNSRKFHFAVSYDKGHPIIRRPYTIQGHPVFASGYQLKNWPKEQRIFPLNSVREAIDWLFANGFTKITHKIPRPEHPNIYPPMGLFQYSHDGEFKLARYLLEDAIEVYREFLISNGLTFLPSKYLDDNVVIRYRFDQRVNPDGPNPRFHPAIIEYYHKRLKDEPKTSLEFNSEALNQCDTSNMIGAHGFSAELIYSSIPHLALCYHWLEEDIKKYFDSPSKSKNPF